MRIPFNIPPREGREFDVVGFGLNSLDLLAVVGEFPKPDSNQQLQRFARLPGGQAATAMVTCRRLGWKSRYVGRFGADEHGRMCRESLEREDIDLSAAVTIEGAFNQFAVILVDARTGQRTVMWDRDPALRMTAADVRSEAIESGRILLVDCHETAAATRAAQIARARGMPTVIDVEKVRPAIRDLLEQIDVIIASQSFPSELTGYTDTGRALQALAEEFPRAPIVCVTLGVDGSLARCGGREFRTPAFAIPCVDSTGAGDVFRGGFIAALLRGGSGMPLEDALQYANAVAALKCRALGARAGIPRAEEVDELLGSGLRGLSS